MDGLSFDLDTWRFNLCRSNTEPVVRVNVEARGDELVEEGVEEGVARVRSLLVEQYR